MELAASSSTEDNICKLCNRSKCRYTCPKCSIGYCSIECYNSTSHSECSEAFYKKCVQEELQSQQCDSEVRRKTLDMLQRIYNEESDDDILKSILQEEGTEEFNKQADLDSDDDDDVSSLEDRLKNINLDNADEIWSALTTSEKQEFEALLRSGDASKLLPSWTPWWSYYQKLKLVEEIAEDNETQMYVNDCPKVLDVPPLQSLDKVSPFIRFSLINTIYAYAYSIMYLNGEHHATPLDAVYIFLRICETIRVNRIFKDAPSAVENVLLEVTNCNALSGDEETILSTKDAGDAILRGPEERNKTFYILAALSDLHQLIQGAKKELSKNSNLKNSEFKNKFQSKIELGSTEISKKNFSLFLKKIEFYIAWLKSQSEKYDITEDEKL